MKIMVRTWTAFGAVVWALTRWMAYIAGGCIFLSIFVLVRESLGRYFFNDPAAWSYPLLKLVLVIVLYFSLAYVATVDGHVSSDVLYSRLPVRGQESIQVISDVVAIVIGYLLAVQTSSTVARALEHSTTIPGLFDLPMAVPQFIIVIGSVMFALVGVTKLPYHVLNLVRGTRTEFPPRSWLPARAAAKTDLVL